MYSLTVHLKIQKTNCFLSSFLANLINESIEQFVPQSEIGRTMKEQLMKKKKDVRLCSFPLIK